MSKFCSDCGKEILLGNKCMDCIKAEQEKAESDAQFDNTVRSVDYKKLTIRICLVVSVLIISMVYAWITDDSATQEETIENESYYAEEEAIDYDTEETAETLSLVKLDDFIKKHDKIATKNSNLVIPLGRNLSSVISKDDETLPLVEYYPTLSKRYMYNIRGGNGNVYERVDVLTDDEDNIIYLQHLVQSSYIMNNKDATDKYFMQGAATFAALTDTDIVDYAYDVALTKAWDLAGDNISGNDELEFGDYIYFYTSAGDALSLTIRAKLDNE